MICNQFDDMLCSHIHISQKSINHHIKEFERTPWSHHFISINLILPCPFMHWQSTTLETTKYASKLIFGLCIVLKWPSFIQGVRILTPCFIYWKGKLLLSTHTKHSAEHRMCVAVSDSFHIVTPFHIYFVPHFVLHVFRTRGQILSIQLFARESFHILGPFSHFELADHFTSRNIDI